MITKENKKTSSFKTIFFQGFGILIVLLAISFLIVSNWRIRQQRMGFEQKIRLLEEEIGILEQEIYQKEQSLLGLGDEEYLEKIARERFHLAKPGEHKVIILPFNDKKVKEEQIREEKNFWEKFLEKLKFWQ